MTADYTLTFGSTAVQLSSVLLLTADRPKSWKFMTLQPGGANAAPVYVGGNNHGVSVSSSAYGFRLEAATTGIPPAPFLIELSNGVIDLTEYWVKGTSSETLHIFLKD